MNTSSLSFSAEGDEAHLASLPSNTFFSLVACLLPRAFEPEHEATYCEWRNKRTLEPSRVVLITGAVSFGSFALWDRVVAPEQWLSLLPLRVLCSVLLLGIWISTFWPSVQKRLSSIMGWATLGTTLGVMVVLNVVPDGPRVGLLGYAFPQLALLVIPQARQAAINGAILLLLANASLWFQSTASATWLSADFFLVCLVGMTYILAFVNEARDRSLFALKQELARLATVDALSGAWNRRHFTHLVEVELERARRYAHPTALLLLDIDFFKKINDSFGHAAGDEAIRSLCATCQGLLRQSDVLGRLGGEEFGILLPETDLEEACALAERLREQVENVRIPTDADREPLRFSTSIGVAQAREGDTFESLMHVADGALYEAKEGGRNRVVALRAR